MKTTIKSLLLGISVIVFGASLTGCVVNIGGGSRGPDHGAPPTVVVANSAEAATIAEIDAVAKLNMDADRVHALGQIVERGALAAPVQVHLVNVTYRSLNLDDSKMNMLTKIIARADFCDATRYAIVSQLGKLSFDSNRQLILQQINERLKAAPAH